MDFPDIGSFIRFMTAMPERLRHANNVGLADGARIVQEDAKAQLGAYQPGAGPFPAWAELAQATKDDRAALGFTPNDPLLRTGELRDHIKMSVGDGHARVGVPDEMVGEGSRADPVRNIGDVAVWMELGTSRAPPRPFLGPAALKEGHAVAEAVGTAVADALAGRPHHRHAHSAGTGINEEIEP